MKRMMKAAVCIALVALCAVSLFAATPAAAQITCTSPNSVYWSPPPQGNGNDNNDGSAADKAVATISRAEAQAVSKGGACIYLTIPGSQPNPIKQVYASTQPPGVPRPTAAVYGLLFALAVALVAVGLWARRKAQAQTGYQPQA